jgi:4-hydroxybenzoate polyprenyltransferase
MVAELQILRDVASYRIRRLEMANLAGAFAIMLALHLPVLDIFARGMFGLGLNLLVYLNNDWHDREDDVDATGREHDKTGFLRAHPAAAVRAQLGLAGLLAGFAVVYGGGLWHALLWGGGVCWAYSAILKRRPFVDVLAMVVWGVAMPMVAVPPGSESGWPLLIQLGLFSGVFETIQVVRDHDDDRARGIRTTAVALGPALTRRLTRLLCLLCAMWAAASFHPLLALPSLVASALPMAPVDTNRTWNRVRFLLGLTLAGECALVWWGGAG